MNWMRSTSRTLRLIDKRSTACTAFWQTLLPTVHMASALCNHSQLRWLCCRSIDALRMPSNGCVWCWTRSWARWKTKLRFKHLAKWKPLSIAWTKRHLSDFKASIFEWWRKTNEIASGTSWYDTHTHVHRTPYIHRLNSQRQVKILTSRCWIRVWIRMLCLIEKVRFTSFCLPFECHNSDCALSCFDNNDVIPKMMSNRHCSNLKSSECHENARRSSWCQLFCFHSDVRLMCCQRAIVRLHSIDKRSKWSHFDRIFLKSFWMNSEFPIILMSIGDWDQFDNDRIAQKMTKNQNVFKVTCQIDSKVKLLSICRVNLISFVKLISGWSTNCWTCCKN